MRRLVGSLLGAVLMLGAVCGTVRPVTASPLADVPASFWAAQAVAQLNADGIVQGYPDGTFRGERPLTRYEMAQAVAKAVDYVRAHGASRKDLQTLQDLTSALKDELDALGVRTTDVEDRLASLDRRTAFAQGLYLHGTFAQQASARRRDAFPLTIVNTTGTPQTTPFGAVVQPGQAAPADPFVTAFLQTDASNDPFATENQPGDLLRTDDEFALGYRATPNISLEMPIRFLSYEFGGAFGQGVHTDVSPTLKITVDQAGPLTNVQLRGGLLDNLRGSLTGLAFTPPSGAHDPGALPLQPFGRGVSIAGTLFGETDFQGYAQRVDPVMLNTLAALDPTGYGTNGYLQPLTPPQSGYVQLGAPGGFTGDVFTAGTAGLANVYLTHPGQLGSVYVSQFNGVACASDGKCANGQSAPNFVFNAATNNVAFTSPLPPGSKVVLGYDALGTTQNTNWQRYMVGGRLVHHVKGYPGFELGLTFNRAFDNEALITNDGVSVAFNGSPSSLPLVSDTVFGIDTVVPLTFVRGSNKPELFAEVATSRYTGNAASVPATVDGAGIAGLKLHVNTLSLTLAFRAVGQNFIDGAPLQFYGPNPAVYNVGALTYLPGFIGVANNLQLNRQFDRNVDAALGAGASSAAGNPAVSYAYPAFNPFTGSGPYFYQSYVPNARGLAADLSVPVKIKGTRVELNVGRQDLVQIKSDAFGNPVYGALYPSSVPERIQSSTAGAKLSLPVFGRHVDVSVSGLYEHLTRDDRTLQNYVPFNAQTQTFDPAAQALSQSAQAAGGAAVPFSPNYVDVHHTGFSAGAGIPVSPDVKLNFSYSTQHFGGSYGTTLGDNIDEHKDLYSGAVTYRIPKTNTSVTVQALHYRYTDNTMPQLNFDQTRQNVYFTVKF
ncbi:S-layer homology domain-containing protein [bacterium]|nr:MAG: S-layer homology domain-containing protein [bacterium]